MTGAAICTLVGLAILCILIWGYQERKERIRRNRPGICQTCNENRVGPGEVECEQCWMEGQW